MSKTMLVVSLNAAHRAMRREALRKGARPGSNNNRWGDHEGSQPALLSKEEKAQSRVSKEAYRESGGVRSYKDVSGSHSDAASYHERAAEGDSTGLHQAFADAHQKHSDVDVDGGSFKDMAKVATKWEKVAVKAEKVGNTRAAGLADFFARQAKFESNPDNFKSGYAIRDRPK